MRPIIDAHLDLAWNAVSWRRDLTLSVDEVNRREAGMDDAKARGRATATLPEMRRGGVAVALGTVLARAAHQRPRETIHSGGATGLDYPSQAAAYAAGRGQAAYYEALEQQGEVTLIRTRGDLDRHWARWRDSVGNSEPCDDLPIGIILAMEGCDPIMSPAQAEQWWGDGLRVASLVHYAHGVYATGTGETGPVTDAGRALLAEFDRLGMILDVTHLCDESFHEALDCFDGPVLASHHNCRVLVLGDRQLADAQIERLIERGGVIGVAMDAWMLYPGWVRGRTSRDVVSLEAVADHIDHVCQLAGNTSHAAIGSDLDGGFGTEQTPRDLNTIADLQRLDAILARRGYGQADIDAVFHGNWLRFFREHLPAD